MSVEEIGEEEYRRLRDVKERIERAQQMVGNVNTNEEVSRIEQDLEVAEAEIVDLCNTPVDMMNVPQSYPEARAKVREIAVRYDISQHGLEDVWRMDYENEFKDVQDSWRHFVKDFKNYYGARV